MSAVAEATDDEEAAAAADSDNNNNNNYDEDDDDDEDDQQQQQNDAGVKLQELNTIPDLPTRMTPLMASLDGDVIVRYRSIRDIKRRPNTI